jgi:hypothetical protein
LGDLEAVSQARFSLSTQRAGDTRLTILLFILFVTIIGLLIALALMSFKTAALYKRIMNLNLLIAEMVQAGISDKALEIAIKYREDKEKNA